MKKTPLSEQWHRISAEEFNKKKSDRLAKWEMTLRGHLFGGGRYTEYHDKTRWVIPTLRLETDKDGNEKHFTRG